MTVAGAMLPRVGRRRNVPESVHLRGTDAHRLTNGVGGGVDGHTPGGSHMHCPFCRHKDSRVLDSRTAEDGASIRRRRQCPNCEKRFTTLEQMQVVIVKRSGVVEGFNRDKVIRGVRKACKGRPVTEGQLALLGQAVEENLRASGQSEVPADQVGVAILGPLRELDEVAYLRFASVYRQYESVEDFENEIASLRENPPTGMVAPEDEPGDADGSTDQGDES